jgi:hypothetical protein
MASAGNPIEHVLIGILLALESWKTRKSGV